MKADCHIHMVLDGRDWRKAIGRHTAAPDECFIRRVLKRYQDLGYTYLRDGGDRWGVGAGARRLAPEYGITYRTPGAPLVKKGHYGGFIGLYYEDLREYAGFVERARSTGMDFIKIMISGLMDFDRFGVLTEPGLPEREITELVHIAHEEGMAVMAHANGTDTVMAAAKAGVDSVEHGAYLDREALAAMVQNHVVWVPTVSTVCNLIGAGRFSDDAVKAIRDSFFQNIADFISMGGLLAPGSDAGAWNVPHGAMTEEQHLFFAGVPDEVLRSGISAIIHKF